MLIFQFTLPREERRQVQAQPLTLQNFNPRSHERSDHITQSFVFRFFNFNPRSHERSDGIRDRADTVPDEISIHAPTRGATAVFFVHCPMPLFQSTLPREERPLWCHIPRRVLYFNPRSHERSDEVRALQIFDDKKFQSTLPREERHSFSAIMFCITKYFNPRSHERSDFKTLL